MLRTVVNAPEAVIGTVPDFVQSLDRFGDRPALIAGIRTVSYADLSDAVDVASARLGRGRRLVAIPASNTVDCVVAYLAALRAGHVVAMLPECRAEDIAAHYRPDSVLGGSGLVDVRHSAEHDLHPDLALLLSTSGSTGSPKMVRLSAANLGSNADAVAESLKLDDSDRGITSLGLSYSYGLSVLNSHLARGAGVVLTSASMTSPEFWDLVRRHEVTSLPCVPYSFDLLDRVGFADLDLPALRRVTAAGGRLAPDTALRYARLGAQRGWGLVVMYGQTEATARMSYLPAHMVEQHPGTVGRPIAGGRVRLTDVDPGGVGELVYEGPNVMLGYATSLKDLARGRDITELRTGDLARITDGGLIEICGRTSRIAKVRGLRLALGDVERALEAEGVLASAVVLDDKLGVAIVGTDSAAYRAIIERATGLPASATHVATVESLPRLDTGKVDDRAVRALVEAAIHSRSIEVDQCSAVEEHLRLRYALMLGTAVGPDDSFASLGGDSLSYVEVSLAVEDVLGTLPTSWESRSIADLATAGGRTKVSTARPSPWWSRARPPWVRGRQLDSTVVLRAVAIILVVGSHAQAFNIRGGAHVLMALIGFNIARFQVSQANPSRRMRLMWRSTAWLLLPALAFVAILAAFTDAYGWQIVGANWLVSPGTMNAEWRYWFIESLLWLLPVMVIMLRVPQFENLRAAYPLGLPLAVTALLFAVGRIVGPQEYPANAFSPVAIAWLLTLGWAIAEAQSARQRVFVSVLLIAVIPWTFNGFRMVAVPLGLVLLLWVSRIRVPATIAVMLAALAQASLLVYLLHWPVLEVLDGWSALAVSCLVGIATTTLVVHSRRAIGAVAGLGRTTNPA